MPKAKELIRKFKKDFERLLEDKDGDHVYQIQLQLFPVTKKIQGAHHV